MYEVASAVVDGIRHRRVVIFDGSLVPLLVVDEEFAGPGGT